MKVEVGLPPEHPMLKAWKRWCETDEFKTVLHWAVALKYDDGRAIDLPVVLREIQPSINERENI